VAKNAAIRAKTEWQCSCIISSVTSKKPVEIAVILEFPTQTLSRMQSVRNCEHLVHIKRKLNTKPNKKKSKIQLQFRYNVIMRHARANIVPVELEQTLFQWKNSIT